MTGEPELRYARASDDVTIAYQMFGRGPVLIWLPSLGHVVAQWRVPALRRAYEALARNLTVVLYDGRGTGSSDRAVDAGDLGVEAQLRDLRAVLDDAAIPRASLLGYYHSVPTAIAFAAQQPQRTDRLVLFGGAPRLRDAMSPAQTQALLSLVTQDWSVFADAAATTWLGWQDGASARGVAEAFRSAVAPGFAESIFAAAREVDVTPLLAHVAAPALVLHRQGERQIPIEVSQRLAAGLPHGELVELSGSTPTLFVEDAERDVALVVRFLTGREGTVPTPFPAPVMTAREQDVLRLLARGDSNAEIARALGITVHTVERHTANLYRKIGARGRTDAAAYALRHGLA